MTVRVTTTDLNYGNVLKTFADDLTTMRKKFEKQLLGLEVLKYPVLDEEIKNMLTLPTGFGVPRLIRNEPIEPVAVFSQREGKGTKYRSEADGNFIISNSAVCYMFDEWQVAARNLVTGTVAALPVGDIITNVDDITLKKVSQEEAQLGTQKEFETDKATSIPLPYVPPPLPKWEVAAANIEAQKVDHDVRLVRDIFDQPLPKFPEFIETPVKLQVPVPGAVQIDPLAPPSSRDLTKVMGSGTQFLTGLVPLQAGDRIVIGVPPLPPPAPSFPVQFEATILTVNSETLITLTEPFPDVYPPSLNPANPLGLAQLPDIPYIPVPIFKVGAISTTQLTGPITDQDTSIPVVSTLLFVEQYGTIRIDDEQIKYTSKTPTSFEGAQRGQFGTTAAPHLTNATANTTLTVWLPVPQPAAVKALQTIQQTFQNLSTTPLEEIVTPLTALTKFTDKTETNYDADILGPPTPLTAPPSLLPGPFGIGKGRIFTPLTIGGRIEIEPLNEGPPAKPLLRQGPGADMALSCVFRPIQPLPGTGWTLASNSSPIPAIPFSTTNYSLQLVESAGHLFPRLTWQFYDTGIVAAAASAAGVAALGAGYGVLVIVATGGVAAGITAASVAKRTCYAQSFVPFPMPLNLAYEYPPSLPAPPPGLPHASKYFLGVTRWKRELSLQTIPLTTLPTYPYMGFMPNFDGILKNPALAFEPTHYGDFVTLGNDGPVYFTSSYELWKAYGSDVIPGKEVIGGTILTWPPFYLGNPPTIFPFPKGKKLYSVGVTFYLGDLETGNFFIDDMPLYGMDHYGLLHGSNFTPGVNTNLPFPNIGELSDFYIGADLQTPYYSPSFSLNGHVNNAGFAAGLSLGLLDTYAIIAAGHAPAPIPSPLPYPSGTYSGDYYMLNIPSSVGKTKSERDLAMTNMFNACFPDYNRLGKLISRSPRSQIPNDGTVYINYTAATTVDAASDDSDIIKSTIDVLLNASSNPTTNTTDAVAEAVGVPPPRADPNDTEKDLPQDGPILVDGRPYLPGDTPVDGLKVLVDVLGYPTATGVTVGTPSRPLLVVSIEERSEDQQVDSCGNSFVKVNVTERILGIDISIPDALFLAGVADPGLLIQRLFWIGGIQLPTVEVQQKLDSFQLDPLDKTAALLGESNGSIEVVEIPDQNVTTKLAGSAQEIEKLFTDRNPVSINISPTSAQMRIALTGLINSPAAATSDGNPGPVAPLMGLFRTVNLAKAFNVQQADLNELGTELAEEVSELCMALFAAASSCIANADLSVVSYQGALAPSLELLNFNIGMAKLNMDVYIPCLGNFTTSASVPTSLEVDINIPRLPTPNELLDNLRNTVADLVSMAEKAIASLDPMRIVQAQMPVIALAVASVGSQASQIVCVPRSLVEALEGGICGIAIPPEVVKECIEGNEKFKLLLDRVKDYSFTASSLVDAVERQFLDLKNLLDSASNSAEDFSNSMDGCLQQISALVANITSIANNSALLEQANSITSRGI